MLKSEQMGRFSPGLDEARLRGWVEYYYLTETFDRGLPGQFLPSDPDCWMVRPDFRATSSRYAESVRRRISEGVGFGDHAAKRDALRLGYEGQRQYMRALGE